MPGDWMFVPASPDISVYVLGMVTRPGQVHRLGSITVSQALSLANHERFGALLSEAKLIRGYPKDPKVVALNLDRLLEKGDVTQDVPMQHGDVLFIPESTTSNVLDFLDRLLRPIARSSTLAVGVIDASSGKGN